MDEPTSGLDARAAAIVMCAVKNVVGTGRTIVCTIHQPCIKIFEAFDEAIPGIPKIMDNYNPLTWMLEVTSTSMEAQLGMDFAQVYKVSSMYNKTLEHTTFGYKKSPFPNTVSSKVLGAVQSFHLEAMLITLENPFLQLGTNCVPNNLMHCFWGIILAARQHKTHNGKAEHVLRTLNNISRTLLIHAHMPPTYWAEALSTATYLLNRRPCSAIGNSIPYEHLFKHAPDYNNLRVFGCLCYPNLTTTAQHKLAPRSIACVFLGYPSSHKGYRCLDLSSRRVIISCHVALCCNNTWQLVPRPPGTNVVTGKWIFKHKFHADGSLTRHKARWVHGIDYDETFSPVVKPATIQVILSIAASRAWPIHQLDVKNAFLHGHLDETPPGFVDPAAPDHICLLQKSLYGLKQAPHAWYQRFATYIRRVGFTASTSDTFLFVFKEGSTIAYLLLYDDDIILIAGTALASDESPAL
ncbi:hypothetical protein U9M48_005726 [Paspalum notatum var. saurae]|uniref:Reverse transcriptase Ty1/copia-type domain-containing protein n=1 Tax=Paspalum notatum var. saurae TaxID=547442 RepID=A0AAQ3SK77_PASNO